MKNIEKSDNILEEFGIIYDPQTNLSQFGGLATFIAFLKKGNFRKRLETEFDVFKARSILQLILGLVAGAKTMKEVGDIAKDPLVKMFLTNPVEEAQLGRDFRKFSRKEIERLHDFVVSLSIRDFVEKVSQDEPLVFDIDATPKIKYGDQEGVERGYVGGDSPEKCYQYLFIRLENRNTFLYGTIRSGSTHSQNDFCGYLDRFLPMLEKRWRHVWRGDSGYFNESAFDRFSENNATFYIKAPMSASRRNMAELSPDLDWREEADGYDYASRVTNTKEGTAYVEVFKRTRKKAEQLSLLGMDNYRYDCIATNDFSSTGDQVFEQYNKRANIENNIKEIKYDYQLGQIVTDSFDANDVITQTTILSYLLMQHFKQEILPPEMSKNRLSTVRQRLFLSPGRLLSQARKSLLRIQNVFVSAEIYQKIFIQIKWVNNLFLMSPS